ncbi:hypothetical protein AGMMS49992_09940 [Clostridia bacterium]|nr:hypothetical protein AGMMS49992_09940 [Clostridia bacterium]
MPTPFDLITKAQHHRAADGLTKQDQWASIQASAHHRLANVPPPEPEVEPEPPPVPQSTGRYNATAQHPQGIPLYPQPPASPAQQQQQQPSNPYMPPPRQPGQPQRIGWNLRDPRGEQSFDPYPRTQAAPVSMGSSKHNNLDAIHKRHEDALKTAVFQTAKTKINVKGSPDDPVSG